MDRSKTFRMLNTPEEMKRLFREVDAFLEFHSVPPRATYAVNLALEELLTNTIKYGYDSAGPHEMLVHLELTETCLNITCTDEARAFDPLSAPCADLDAPLHEREAGGLGIHLIKEFCETVRYDREGPRNVVRVRVALR